MPNNPITRRANAPAPLGASGNKLVRGTLLNAAVGTKPLSTPTPPSAAAGGGGGGGGSPGGSTGQIQYNSSGVFAGTSDLTTDSAGNLGALGATFGVNGIINNGAKTAVPVAGYATSGTVQLRPDLGETSYISITGNCAFTDTGWINGRKHRVILRNSSGSSRTLSWPSWVAANGTLPASLANGASLTVSLVSTGTSSGSVFAIWTGLSGVTPGSYTLSSITVDAAGRVTAASSGSAGGGHSAFVYPEDHGAVGDGVTDDSVAIMAAYLACAPGQAVCFSGTYALGTAANTLYGWPSQCSGAGLFFDTPGIGFVSMPGATLVPSASAGATTGVIISGGNYTSVLASLPSMASFTTICVRLMGAAFLDLSIGLLQAGAVGLDLYCDATYTAVQACSVRVAGFGNFTTSAIQLQRTSTNVGVEVQGNTITTVFVTGSNRWVYYANNGLSGATPNIENCFICNAFDPGNPGTGAHLVGAVYMIDNECGGESAQNRFTITSGIYNMVPGDQWVKGSYTQGLDQCDFDFGPGTSTAFASGSPSTAQQYAIYQNVESSNVYGSRICVCAGMNTPAGLIAAATSAASRSTFNSGNAIWLNRFLVSFTVSSLTAGSTATFYIYSPLVQGAVRANLVPFGSVSGLAIDEISDNSGTNANELKVVLRNLSGSTITGPLTVAFYLILGIP